MAESHPPAATSVPPGGGSGTPPDKEQEKKFVAALVAEVKGFIDKIVPARNKLDIDPVLGISPERAARIKESAEALVQKIQVGHGESSQEQLQDFLLEDVIVLGGLYNEETDGKGNAGWFGKQGDAFSPHKLHDLAGYRTDGYGVLPAREAEAAEVPSPMIFRFDATTGAEFAPMKKMWLILHDIVKAGHFGNVPFVSVKMRGAPEARAAGLVGAARVVLAASRQQTLRVAVDILRLKRAGEAKERGDKGDEKFYLDKKTRQDAINRMSARLQAIEQIEEELRVHDIQLQFANQMCAQFTFFRDFTSLHLRKVNRALYKIDNGGEELPEDDRKSYEHLIDRNPDLYARLVAIGAPGKGFAQKEEDDKWGTCGEVLPTSRDELKKLADELTKTRDRLILYERTARATREELVLKLYTSELDQGKAVKKRRKGYARPGSLEELTADDPSHLSLMALATDREAQIAMSKLSYKDLGFNAPPPTKTW